MVRDPASGGPTLSPVIRLERTVRFSVNPGGEGDPLSPDTDNGYAARPSMAGLGRHYELDITCAGEPDKVTGYLMNIQEIDRAARTSAVRLIATACATDPTQDPGSLMPSLFEALDGELGGRLVLLRWRLAPYYGLEMTRDSKTTFVLRQRFDFAAAHRLHSAQLSDEENREMFGKCNLPCYHGHNYQVEPAVEIDSPSPTFNLQVLERLVAEHVIDHFDHLNLNLDTSEFKTGEGLNPSVENIARVCYEILAPVIQSESGGSARLRDITVWETDRTSCCYPG